MVGLREGRLEVAAGPVAAVGPGSGIGVGTYSSSGFFELLSFTFFCL